MKLNTLKYFQEELNEDLSSKIISNKNEYELAGKEIGKLYHAGKKHISKILKSKLGQRDEGYYGKGFYVSFDKKYVEKWYGEVVTIFKARKEAKILRASVDYSKSSNELFKKIIKNELKLLKDRGEEKEIKKIEKELKENQIEWVHAVDRFAEEEKFDIIIFNDYEIVIKNNNSVEIVN